MALESLSFVRNPAVLDNCQLPFIYSAVRPDKTQDDTYKNTGYKRTWHYK